MGSRRGRWAAYVLSFRRYASLLGGVTHFCWALRIVGGSYASLSGPRSTPRLVREFQARSSTPPPACRRRLALPDRLPPSPRLCCSSLPPPRVRFIVGPCPPSLFIDPPRPASSFGPPHLPRLVSSHCRWLGVGSVGPNSPSLVTSCLCWFQFALVATVGLDSLWLVSTHRG